MSESLTRPQHVFMPDRVHLSRMTKLPVVTADGRYAGRLIDVSAVLSGEPPALHRIAIGAGHRVKYIVPWSFVASHDDLGIRLTADLAGLEHYGGVGPGGIALSDEELLLVRDVLDCQVVDLSGRRLSRISDVLLADSSAGLSVVAVDLGLGALLRRLGLVRLGNRMRPVLVAWNDLHLVSSRGHNVQLATGTDGLRRLDSAALAEVLARLATARAVDVLRNVGPSRSALALDASHDIHRRRLLRALSPEEAHRVIAAAPASLGPSLEDAHDESAAPGRRFRRTAGWRVHRPNPRASNR